MALTSVVVMWSTSAAPRVEQRDGMAGGPVDGEVGEDLADHRDELEAVPGESAGHRHVGAPRVAAR